MMTTTKRIAMLAAVALSGCGARPGPTPEAPAPVAPVATPAPAAEAPGGAPKVGAKVLVREGAAVWKYPAEAAEHARAYATMKSAEARDATRAIDHLRVGAVLAGDLVEVLEVGDGYAGVDVLSGGVVRRDEGGAPMTDRLRGYVKAWWR